LAPFQNQGLLRAEPFQNLCLMVDGDHGEAKLLVPENKIVDELADQLTIQTGKRLVDQKKSGAAGKSARQAYTPRLSARYA